MVWSVDVGVGTGEKDGFRAVNAIFFDDDGHRDAVRERTQDDSFHRRFGGVEASLSVFCVEREAGEIAEAVVDQRRHLALEAKPPFASWFATGTRAVAAVLPVAVRRRADRGGVAAHEPDSVRY